jgi:hypothetical protein
MVVKAVPDGVALSRAGQVPAALWLPDSLKHFWSGHAQKHTSERYVKLLQEREYRLEWAERIGLGFKIPTSVGLPGLLRVVPNAA